MKSLSKSTVNIPDIAIQAYQVPIIENKYKKLKERHEKIKTLKTLTKYPTKNKISCFSWKAMCTGLGRVRS